MYYITDFGAVGDGVTDSLPAFNKALAAARIGPSKGGTIVISQGTFYCSDNIFLRQITRFIGSTATGGDGSPEMSCILFAKGKGIIVCDAAISGDGGHAFFSEIGELFLNSTPLEIGDPTGIGVGTVRGFWTPFTAYVVGDLVVAPNDNRYVFLATVAGTSGATIPMFEAGFGLQGVGPNTGMALRVAPFPDGGVVWTTDSYSAIKTFCNINVHDVTISGFTNSGLHLHGNLTDGSSETSGSLITNVFIGSCGTAVVVNGGDASNNIGTDIVSVDAGEVDLFYPSFNQNTTNTIIQSDTTSTLTTVSSRFAPWMVGMQIAIGDTVHPSNNGDWTVTAVLSPNQLQWTNPAGITTTSPHALVGQLITTGGYGIVDQSFYGGTYVNCNIINGTGQPYYRPGGLFSATLIGCYAEGGQPPTIWAGLHLGGEVEPDEVRGIARGYDAIKDLFRHLRVGFTTHQDYPAITLDDANTLQFLRYHLNGSGGHLVHSDNYTQLCEIYQGNKGLDRYGWWVKGLYGHANLTREMFGYSTLNSDEGAGFVSTFRGEFRGETSATRYYIAFDADVLMDPQLRMKQGVGGHWLVGDRYEPKTSGTGFIGQVVKTAGWKSNRIWQPGINTFTYDLLGRYATTNYGMSTLSVHPVTPDGFTYISTVAGTSAGTEPIWTNVTGFLNSATHSAVAKGSGPSTNPVVPYRWTSGVKRQVGDYGCPSTSFAGTVGQHGRNGHFYVVTAISGPVDDDGNGITGNIEPTWPTGSGSTVVDNGITWTEQGSDIGTYIYDGTTEWQCVGPEPVWTTYGAIT